MFIIVKRWHDMPETTQRANQVDYTDRVDADLACRELQRDCQQREFAVVETTNRA